MKAVIFNIARCSLHDGNGIRTVVYFKGCNMRCQWCHNPESLSAKAEILFYSSRCIKCGRCVRICPEHHIISGNDVIYKKEGCTLCMKCVEACPNEALLSCGKEMSPNEVYDEILKDKHYYDVSGGGVTFSGGECLLYADFLYELLVMCKHAGINTSVETAFNVPWNTIEKIYNLIDCFIIDIKHSDCDIHKELTGCSNHLILDNIKRISFLHPSILIRIPLIPNANDDDENLIGTAKLINTFGKGIKAVELLKYNNLARSKYIALGKKPVLFADGTQDDETMKQKGNLLKKHLKENIQIIY